MSCPQAPWVKLHMLKNFIVRLIWECLKNANFFHCNPNFLQVNNYFIYNLFKFIVFSLQNFYYKFMLKILPFKANSRLQSFLTCFMASTTVTVLPVPGGPKTRYGAGREVPETIWRTAENCSSLRSSCWSYNLKLLISWCSHRPKTEKQFCGKA